MPFVFKPANRNVSDDELLEDLRKVAAALGATSMSRDEYASKGKFSHGTLRKRFGGWNKALLAAGLSRSTGHAATEEELFENLEKVWLCLGRQPTIAEMKPPLSKFGGDFYRQRFGTWMKALEQFVTIANSPSAESKESQEESPAIDQGPYKHKTKRDINWRLRFKVFHRDNFRCVSCGRSPAKNPEIELHADHIIAWSKGGETILENLQTLCSVCNLGKSNIEI
jgi:hypothetical protein